MASSFLLLPSFAQGCSKLHWVMNVVDCWGLQCVLQATRTSKGNLAMKLLSFLLVPIAVLEHQTKVKAAQWHVVFWPV